jgi:hypothetical protein
VFNRFAIYRDKKVVGVFVRFRAPLLMQEWRHDRLDDVAATVIAFLLRHASGAEPVPGFAGKTDHKSAKPSAQTPAMIRECCGDEVAFRFSRC